MKKVKELGLSEEQKVKVKEVRRKGKNNKKAAECTERSKNQIEDKRVTLLAQSEPINYQ